MRYLLLIGALLAGSAYAAAPATSQNQRDLVKYLIASEKKTIKDAIWMSKDNLYVGAIDDGTDRKGLAMYVCAVASERKAPAKMVKVVDIVKVQRAGKFEELGRADCL
ncbi:hypothetical protein [Pseudomonas sp. UMAB-08]|uniref:hypothetical protein n=1 Tax=Pseudomonas sp. UMAB-08 TaxID=1365375 RepID=UPI001C59E8FF|nr:hypothetical protein [Pseudomonas sp. UMAB-08]